MASLSTKKARSKSKGAVAEKHQRVLKKMSEISAKRVEIASPIHDSFSLGEALKKVQLPCPKIRESWN